MNNYEFCVHWLEQRVGPPARVLDYGCGAGQVVALMRKAGFDGAGCDVFYEGGNYFQMIAAELRPHIRRMDGDRIPFEDASFDFVVTNQVLEHVRDLDVVLREISRVLKPGGALLAMFPDGSVWREGHCGVPFLHWFPKRSKPRVYYAAAWRALGFGTHHKGKPIMQWSRDFCDWLDKWTYYRPLRDLHASFRRWIGQVAHIEDDWLAARNRRIASIFPAWAQRLLVRKLGQCVFCVVKAQ